MNGQRQESVRIVLSMVTTCVIGAAVLGGVYVATARLSEAQERAAERRDVTELLALDASARVLEVRQFLVPERGQVVYRVAPIGGGEAPRELILDLDGRPVDGAGGAAAASDDATLRPLGRMFVASAGGAPTGFVVEGTANGYKNRIRFLVGLRPDFEIAGVRVVEHEEDPGLGAEIATPEFEGQFLGRAAEGRALEVTRDPLPEDWRRALIELRRLAPAPWRDRHAALVERERARPVHAVTGATISSRALADGVRVTVERFRSRWERIAPWVIGEAS
jgi:electron transport complex protein RnfG